MRSGSACDPAVIVFAGRRTDIVVMAGFRVSQINRGKSMNIHLRRARVAAALCAAFVSTTALADNVVADDQIVQGSQCIGFDCVNNENFGFDTLRLKENNLRIDFEDTSSSSNFPSNDWGIVVNDSANGGANYFMIEDRGADGSSADSVFRIDAGANGAMTFGFGSTSSGDHTLSIGSAGDERRITNLAAGTAGTDAVNVDQMNAGDAATLSAAQSYADAGDAATLSAAQSYADAGDAATLSAAQSYADIGDANTLAAAQSHADAGDAATLDSAQNYADAGDAATLSSARTYTDQKIEQVTLDYSQFKSDVWERLDRTDRRIDRMGAMTTAMAQMTANAAGGRSPRGRIAVGMGAQNGQGALSLGYGRALGARGSLTFGAAFSGSESTAGLGFGFDL